MKEDSSYSSEGEVCMNAIEETIYTIRKSRNNAFKKTGINMKYGYIGKFDWTHIKHSVTIYVLIRDRY